MSEEQLELFPELVESSLEKASKIIYGDREKTYGTPARNLDTVAMMWTAYLRTRMDIQKGGTFSLTNKDVCVLMTLLKAARFANDPSHTDNVVDAIGYWALVDRCESKS